ncbi:uncharacterized protein FFB20_04836 [Fusarium fujikuroi]|uniref:Uncharacterized protein n=1 Tax=Fusarium fujikuroi TaxID=5127 RepID=A0A2H3S428_FUSFU|nr:uncharacterized protein FFB20_04836 [Fusarium fujikuroi]SCN76676.1 uncharacterized protein FFE2_03598 [Fusarium fujikuroi]SCN94940.1 uncharacterized protein FFC1_07178 [Fusarium fujikuroi]VTT63446.1 unnamed protein product [Fusarium fujikuroi]VTT78713.1 unnamed protein product [Fusarium fujikuroi]
MQAGRAFRDVGINNVVQPNSFIGPLLAGDQVMIDEYTAYIQDEKARVGLYTAWLWYALAIDLNILLFSSLAMAVAREDAGLRDERPLSFPQRRAYGDGEAWDDNDDLEKKTRDLSTDVMLDVAKDIGRAVSSATIVNGLARINFRILRRSYSQIPELVAGW